jgi:hypothetical protein
MTTSECYKGFILSSKELEDNKFIITILSVATTELIQNSVFYDDKTIESIDENNKWFSIKLKDFISKKSQAKTVFTFESETPFKLDSVIDFEESTRFNILDSIYSLKKNRFILDEPTLIKFL